MQAQQVLIGQMKQVVQRQTLGKFAEFVAFGGTNQAVQTLPDFAVLGLLLNLCEQRLLCGPVLRIVLQAGAVCAQLLHAVRTLSVYLGNVRHDSLGRGIGQCLGLQCGQALLRIGQHRIRTLHLCVQLFAERLQALLQEFGLEQALGARFGLTP